jgi:hypothetical protein
MWLEVMNTSGPTAVANAGIALPVVPKDGSAYGCPTHAARVEMSKHTTLPLVIGA